MKNMSIKNKLKFVLAIMIALSAVLGLLGAGGMVSMSRNEGKMHQMGLNLDHSTNLVTALLELRIELRQTVVSVSDPEAVEKNIAYMNSCDERFNAFADYLQRNLFTQAGKDKLKESVDLYNYLVDERQDFHRMARAGDEEGMLVWLREHIDQALQVQYYAEELNQMSIDYMNSIDVTDTRVSMVLIICMLIIAVVAVLAATLLGRRMFVLIVTPIERMAKVAEKLAEGDISVDVEAPSNDEVGVLARSFHKMIDAVRMQAKVVNAVAHGDYTVSIPRRSHEDVINQSISLLVEQGNEMLTEIREASDQVYTGAEQIAIAAQNLAAGSSEQAATVEQFSAALSAVLGQTQSNAEGAGKALDVSAKAGQLMEESTQSMHQMLEAMHSIDESSKSVARVIKVIEDIAFQTNILALNAAVEAARAGQHGKGFAVVADEVRNLASKSAAAAKETSDLIAGSLKRVGEGNAIVERTSSSLESVSQYSTQSLELIQQIAEASALQANSISEIDDGINQIFKVVQANSATAEESAASAEQMSTQSGMLQKMVSRYKLKSMRSHIDRNLPEQASVHFDQGAMPTPPRIEPMRGFALSVEDKY